MKRSTGQDRKITSKWRQATRAVRGGTWRSEQGETSEAIFLTSGYSYDDARTPAARFAGQEPGMTYSRTQNPSVQMLEERIALMEGERVVGLWLDVHTHDLEPGAVVAHRGAPSSAKQIQESWLTHQRSLSMRSCWQLIHFLSF